MSQPPYQPYGQQPQQPYGQPYPPYGQPQQAYGQPPAPPYPMQATTVTKKAGVSARGHSIHLTLTLFTCGAWAPIWFCWWLFRLVVRRKQKTTTYYG